MFSSAFGLVKSVFNASSVADAKPQDILEILDVLVHKQIEILNNVSYTKTPTLVLNTHVDKSMDTFRQRMVSAIQDVNNAAKLKQNTKSVFNVIFATSLCQWPLEKINELSQFFAVFKSAPVQLVVEADHLAFCDSQRLNAFIQAIKSANVTEFIMAYSHEKKPLHDKGILDIIKKLLPSAEISEAAYGKSDLPLKIRMFEIGYFDKHVLAEPKKPSMIMNLIRAGGGLFSHEGDDAEDEKLDDTQEAVPEVDQEDREVSQLSNNNV